jgi:hypothetical protein
MSGLQHGCCRWGESVVARHLGPLIHVLSGKACQCLGHDSYATNFCVVRVNAGRRFGRIVYDRTKMRKVRHEVCAMILCQLSLYSSIASSISIIFSFTFSVLLFIAYPSLELEHSLCLMNTSSSLVPDVAQAQSRGSKMVAPSPSKVSRPSICHVPCTLRVCPLRVSQAVLCRQRLPAVFVRCGDEEAVALSRCDGEWGWRAVRPRNLIVAAMLKGTYVRLI